uniref:F-box protein SKIP27-like n=1 Tax=Erigeron canadensis TaxID=72917 RepID=UPI001CB89CE6|nr:F-box protein SKIP27-like [Erigeron canadensis]
MAMGVVRRTSSFGRKRIFISNEIEDIDMISSPSKKPSIRKDFGPQVSFLEALPQDILIRVLCGVEHDDLKTLVRVSKLICEAAMLAKKLHFAYSTPKKVPAFRCALDQSSVLAVDEIEAPNAPKRLRVTRSRLDRNKIGDLSVALFGTNDENEEGMSKKNLFYGMEF